MKNASRNVSSVFTGLALFGVVCIGCRGSKFVRASAIISPTGQRLLTHMSLQKSWRHLGSVLSVACSDDGRRFASVGEDGIVRFVSDAGVKSMPLRKGLKLSTASLSGNLKGLFAVGQYPKRSADQLRMQSVALWDLGTGKARWETLNPIDPEFGDQIEIDVVLVSKSGEYTAFANTNDRHTAFDFSRTRFVEGNPKASDSRDIDRELDAPVYAAAFSPDSRSIFLWTGGNLSGRGFLEKRDALTLKKQWAWEHPISKSSFQQKVIPVVSSCVVSSDSAQVAASYSDCSVKLHDATTGVPRIEMGGLKAPAKVLAFSPDNAVLVTSGSTVIWSAELRKNVAVGAPGTLTIWDTKAGQVIGERRFQNSEVKSLCFSQDGSHLLTGYANGIVSLYKIAS